MRAPASPTRTTGRVLVRLQPCPRCRRSIRLDNAGAEVGGRPHVDYAAVDLAGRLHERSCEG